MANGLIQVATWHCHGLDRVPCDQGGTGDPQKMDLAARKHLDATQHGTCLHTRPVKGTP
jgi:hypothetical protein